MFRSTATALLILAGGCAVAAVFICVLAVRIVTAAIVFALSGIRRRAACEEVLSW